MFLEYAPIRGVKGHSQLFSRVLRTVSVCVLDLRHIYNVLNLTNLQILMSLLLELDVSTFRRSFSSES